jgi:hypothetical protein
VSRRARAAAFTAAAAVCAALAAASAGGSGGGETSLGTLRDVVVATQALPARRALERKRIDEALEIRRIPVAFTAPDALTNPAQALGRRPAALIPAGSYLVGSQLIAARPDGESGGPSDPALADGVRPVEITVSAAAPVASHVHGRVDVVVTAEPTTGAGGGRTYVAARAVELLDLAPAAEGSGVPSDPLGAELSVATLGLTHAQALRLIHAESFAREVRLIAS